MNKSTIAAKLVTKYSTKPYTFPSVWCGTVVQDLIGNLYPSLESAIIAKYEAWEGLTEGQAFIKAIKTHNGQFEAHLSVLRSALIPVEQAPHIHNLEPTDLVFLYGNVKTRFSALEAKEKGAMMGIVGADFGIYVFGENGLEQVSNLSECKVAGVIQCLKQ